MFFILLEIIFSSTQRAIPSYWLNNWNSDQTMIAFWNAASNSWTVPPSNYPGIQSVRGLDRLNKDIFINDTFSMNIDGVSYREPQFFNSSHLGGCVQESDGELWTEYTHYKNDKLPIILRRSFYQPPNELYYLVKYSFSSQDGRTHKVELLDFLSSAECRQWGRGHCEDGICTVDQHWCSNEAFATSVDSSSKAFTMGNGDPNNDDNPLKAFREKGTIPNFPDYNQVFVAFGSVYSIDVSESGNVDLIVYRGIGDNIEDARNTVNSARSKGFESIRADTKRSYYNWMNSGIIPSGLSDDSLDLYRKSLLVLKNSQNPKVGTIASSLHILYGYKNWMRDSIMAAFMLDSAGFHDEAKKYFEWVDRAPLTDKGAFHTCYNTFTGSEEGFVEPQYDSVGIYLMSMNYHMKCFDDSLDFTKAHLSTIEREADWLVANRGEWGLCLSDRAPWEESTDHHTGEDIPEQYYTWTVGCSYGGLIAASEIEKKLNNAEKAQKYKNRADEIKTAATEHLWNHEEKRFYRGIKNDHSLQADTRAESSSLSAVFTGMITGDDAKSHLDFILGKLTHLESGIARYEHDPYFFDSIWNPCGRGTMETQRDEPSWPVTTAYAAWAEAAVGRDFQKRIDWMLKYSAYGNMPTGEAVDSADGALVVPSSPDGFEHGGVYVYTTLLKCGLAKSLLDTLEDK